MASNAASPTESARRSALADALLGNGVVIGKRDEVELVLCALLCEGHT